MSKHWIAMAEDVMNGTTLAITEAIQQLKAMGRHDLVEVVAAEDWNALRKRLAIQALHETANEVGAEVRSEYRNSVRGYENGGVAVPMKGSSIGVIAKGDVQLGFAYDDADSALSVFVNGYSNGSGADDWKAVFTQKFRALQAAAVLAKISGNVTSTKVGGADVVGAMLPKKVRA